jgi:sortase A
MRRAAVVLLLLLSAVSFVQGSWIYGKALVAQVLLRRAWSEAREGEVRARPWPWADTWPVARLVSPAHDVDLIVLEGATGSTTAFGPGHIEGTARPGELGNLALAGHRDTHFAFLRDVEPGDVLWIELPSGALERFEVNHAKIIDESETELIEVEGPWLTLVTCYPFDDPVPGGPLRYVVQARRV